MPKYVVETHSLHPMYFHGKNFTKQCKNLNVSGKQVCDRKSGKCACEPKVPGAIRRKLGDIVGGWAGVGGGGASI